MSSPATAIEFAPSPSGRTRRQEARRALPDGWRRLVADFALVGSSGVFCQMLGMATSLLLRMFLAPAEMGIWQALKLLLGYANYANLGVSKGAVREFNVALGRGDTARAERGLGLAFTVNSLTSAAYAAALLGAAAWLAATQQGPWTQVWAAGLAVVAAMVVVSRYVTFQVTILRAAQDFAATSQLAAMEAILTLSLCVPAAWCLGLPGVYGGTLGVLAATCIFVVRRQVVRLRWTWDRAEAGRLVAVGLPILLMGIAQSLLATIDKLAILRYASDREFQLGCYSVTQMVAAQLLGLGNMLAIVIGPRLARHYGQCDSRAATAQLAAKASQLQALVLALPAGLALVAGPAVLGRLLPDYRQGLAPLLWIVPGVVAQAMALPAAQYLVAVDRQNRGLIVLVAAILVACVGNRYALVGGYGLNGVAAATAAAYLLYFLGTTGVSIWPDLGRGRRGRYLAAIVLAVGPVLAAALVVAATSPTNSWRTAGQGVAMVVAVWLVAAAVQWRLLSRTDAPGRS